MSYVLREFEQAQDILRLYGEFDGFEVADPVTLTWLWPIARVLEFRPSYDMAESGVAFADIHLTPRLLILVKRRMTAYLGCMV